MASHESNSGHEQVAQDSKSELVHYVKPQILCKEKLEAAAVSCNFGDGKADAPVTCVVTGS
jgi:hypothetical protein